MFSVFGRRKKARPPTPSWVKWMLILFVFYAFVSNLNRDRDADGSRTRQSIDKAARELKPSNFVNLSEYKNKIFPEGTSLRVKDIVTGKGNPAVCGQEVNIAYEAFLEDGKPTGGVAAKETSLTFRIGEGTAMPALEQGTIGMRPGGKRTLLAKPEMAYGSKGHAREGIPENAMVRFEVELIGATPALPDIASTPYRIFENTSGYGSAITCGRAAKVRLTIWSNDGKKIFATKDNEFLQFVPGKSEVFLGLEQGAIGMRPGGARTLIVPPSFQKTMHGNKPVASFTFPAGQTVIVDVEAGN